MHNIAILTTQYIISRRIFKQKDLSGIDYIAIPIQLFCCVLFLSSMAKLSLTAFSLIASLSFTLATVTCHILINYHSKNKKLKYPLLYSLSNILVFILYFIASGMLYNTMQF